MRHAVNVKFLLLVLFCSTLGCGSDGIALVAGRVTLRGQPLADASLTFQPLSTAESREPGVGSYGRTDSAGRYTLRRIEDDRPGAQVGKHAVTISTGQHQSDADGAKLVGEKVPARFRDGSLQFDVPAAGTAAADFEVGGK